MKRLIFGLVVLLLLLVGVFVKQQFFKPKVSHSSQNSTVMTPISEWLDLSLIKPGFNTKALSLSVGKILVLDQNQKTLASVDLANKSAQILAGKEDLGEASLASVNGEKGFVFSSNQGIIRVDLETKELSPVVKKNPELGFINQLVAFAGNLYLQTPTQIYKYLPNISGYSDKKTYLQSPIDLSEVIKMQIDSSVWLLKADGEIVKLTQGFKDSFSYSGLNQGVKEPKSFFVSSETDNLYLLDSGNSRLLVLDKTGKFISEYQGNRFKDFIDLVVDEEGKKVYLLDGAKVYSMELK